MTAHGELRIGVCGFCRPQCELFARYELLEVQQTFYRPPMPKTVERWRAAAAPEFEFTLKAYQAITHCGTSPTYRRAKLTSAELAECGEFRDNVTVREAWQVTRTLAELLKATAIVFQCPPSFIASDENVAQLRRFFHWIERGHWMLVWEPRHESWDDPLIDEVCAELNLVHAVDPLERPAVTGPPQYFRLHGVALGRYRYQYNHPYTAEELDRVIEHCRGGPTYCLFNNLQMAVDALRMAELAFPQSGATQG